jgi:hypothetical protein
MRECWDCSPTASPKERLPRCAPANRAETEGWRFRQRVAPDYRHVLRLRAIRGTIRVVLDVQPGQGLNSSINRGA